MFFWLRWAPRPGGIFPLSHKVECVFFVGSPDLIVAGGNSIRQRLTTEMDEETEGSPFLEATCALFPPVISLKMP